MQNEAKEPTSDGLKDSLLSGSTDPNNLSNAQPDSGSSGSAESDHDDVSITAAKRQPRKERAAKSSKRRAKYLGTETPSGDADVSTENNSSSQPDADLSKREKTVPQPKKKSGKKKQKYGSFTRRLWNDDEDDAIIRLVDKYGIRKWTLISRKLQEEYQIHGRSGKQCRERYISFNDYTRP